MISQRMKEGLRQIGLARKGVPDYVPVQAQCGAHTARLTGVDIEKFLTNPQLFVESHLMVADYYEFCAPSLTYDMYNIEAEALGQRLVWLPGQFPEIDQSNPLIANPKDFDHLRPPDPYKNGRMPFIMEFNKRCADLGLNQTLRFAAPFSVAANVRGIQSLLLDIMMQPSFAHKLLRFITYEVLAPWIEAQRREAGVGLVALGGDALASIPIINLEIMKEFALQYILELQKLLGDVEVRGWWGESLLSEPEKMLMMKLKAQPSLIMGWDPDVYALGAQMYKEFAVRQDVLLVSGVGVPVIAQGPIENIIDRVRNYVEIGGAGGRFILFFCDVAPETPSEHVHAAVQAARYFGSRENLDQPDGLDFELQPRECFEEWKRSRKGVTAFRSDQE